MKKIYKLFLKNYDVINKHYEYLVNLTKNHIFVGSTNEWIIDNFYLIVETKNNLKKSYKNSNKFKHAKTNNVNMYDIIENIFIDNNYDVSYRSLVRSLNNYQNKNNCYFTYQNINVIPSMIGIVIIKKLSELCVIKRKQQEEKQKVRNLMKKIENHRQNGEKVNLKDYITIDETIINNEYYLEQLNSELHEYGALANEIFKELNEMLEKHNINLKEIAKKQHTVSIENNILIANLFNELKMLSKIDNLTLINKISKTEKLLEEDETYPNMTIETKELYRAQIIKNTKNIDEYAYAEKMMQESKRRNKHIGEVLLKEPNYEKRAKIYISLAVILTVPLSLILSNYLFESRLLGFIVLLIPISEVVIQIINKILTKMYPCKPIPKMDYSKGIPKDNATMVVIPTIIKNKNKIDEMFEKLESYYLANKTNNLYFSLLGDCFENDKSEHHLDAEISQYGIQKANELNKKYKKKIFYFVYRQRVYNTSEDKYIGYERKRGGLLHFNKLLLNTMSPKDKEKYIYCETLSELDEPIKYVITLDTDTELILGAAPKLVGLMAHPLNLPILNKEKTKVVKGYGIVQPRIGIDIEATNASSYSQLIAGIGGLDVYSSIVPNLYQDAFGEGSFWGKGIYDLEVYNQVLENAFPDNLILSHDLIESNYLRCGYASDIEVVDGFPAEFLVDTSRQHRWTRGDIQIIGWLKKKVKNKTNRNVKNPISSISKFKIFDNLRRVLFNPSLLLIVILSFYMSKIRPMYSLIIVIVIIALPIIFYIREFLNIQAKRRMNIKYYDDLLFGNFAIIARVIISFITIPYYSYLYLDATCKSLYRMFISHKNLLNWITSEDASKMTKNDIPSYIKNFKANYLVVLLLIIATFVFNFKYFPAIIILCILFLSAPFVMWLVSQKNKKQLIELSKKEKSELKEVAFKTWLYFDTLLTEDNNYLIPDNLQTNREEKEDVKTSPTDIAMSLTSIISAHSLEFVDGRKAIRMIDKIIASIETLEKWNGHLYNWYRTSTKEKMYPFYVSSVDSGNLAITLLTLKEFLKSITADNELIERVEKLFTAMDFSKFYTDQNVFSIGYDTIEERLSPYNYNKFASESRILSFIAIVKGDVPSKHWLCLDKTLTKYKNRKGLVSWSGTSFEYFMPMIYMKSYSNTLLDESYHFATFCQKEYIKEVNEKLPWGISESAYAELDDGLNYKYKAFDTPYLKMIEDKEQRIVISPYSSILAIDINPRDVYKNMHKLNDLGMYGDLGYYESYDYDKNEKVLAYFAHHQGMILASLANHLKGEVIRNYFHRDVRVQSFNILLKEKVQLNPIIDLKMFGYKKYNYARETVENDIREFNAINEVPEISVLSNSKYSLLINDRGNGFSRYKKIQLNRYRKITEQDYGNYLYIKDLDTKKVWSNTYAPTNVKPDKYNVVFATDRIKFLRMDNGISTKTEIIVTSEKNAEIRKVTFKNTTDEVKKLELTTYTEVIIEENIVDVTHRTFHNLFVSSEFDKETNSLIMCRKNNSKKTKAYFISKLLIPTEDANISYETERANFIGRNNNVEDPQALRRERLSNTVGSNIDPVMSLRSTITIEPGKKKTVYYICGFAKSKAQVLDIVTEFDSKARIKKAFDYATLSNNINTKQLNITGPNMRTFNIMLNYLYQTSKHFVNDERKALLGMNSMNQTNLWKFGITGDLPVILVEINESESTNFVEEILKAYEYFKTRAIFVDIVIINREKDRYKEIINHKVEQELYRMNTLYNFYSTPGSVYVLDSNNVSPEEDILFNMIARLRFNTKNDKSLEESITRLQRENKMGSYDKNKVDRAICDKDYNEELDFFNGYGGFTKDGKEYVITNPDTPTPWTNIIANRKFGTIISNNECGFTYAYNSQMFKITSWTNDIVLNDKSEGIKINDIQVDPKIARHGFGYSTFIHEGKEYELTTTQFVASEDTIKFYKSKLKNKTSAEKKFKVTFWMNPTFGPNEEKSSRYLLSDYYEEMNAILIRNVYNIDFSHITAFLSSTLPIKNYSIDRVLVKSIDIEIDLKPGEEKDFSFMLGTEIGNDKVKSLIEKYNNKKIIDSELDFVKDKWTKELSIIKVKTKDKSFDNVMNGWYLYQTLSSRIYARAGFYQVGGAYGFRDQLQDTTNIVTVSPEYTKEQIINNAKHQFMEGDVLHWWHEDNRLGLRSRYKDDYLWLIYATSEYCRVTGDYKFLDEKIPFVSGALLADWEEERGMNYNYTKETATLYEHCLIALNRSMNQMGKNGLPLMGGGDWNDGMNKVGIGGKGTSVWLGFFQYWILGKFIEMTKIYNKKLDTSKYEKAMELLKHNLNTIAWEKDYYLRAFFDDGTKMGSMESDECKIDLLSQSFSILTDVAERENISKILNSVETNLVDKNLAIVKLLTPAFKKTKHVPGYIMDYPEGVRENGGQYTHSVAWYIMALIKSGYHDRAYNYYQMINPVNRAYDEKSVNRYKVEPYVIAADIYSNKNNPGRGGWTWYSGSAGWFYNVGLTEILGFKKEDNTIRFKPSVPSGWKSFELEYHYLETTYKIKVNVNSTKDDIILDGEKQDKDYITIKNDKRIHAIVVNVKG